MNFGLKLSDFRARVADFARPNRFECVITPPPIYEKNIDDMILTHWLLQSATIPSRKQGEVVIKYHGMELKLSGDYTKEDITLTFLNSYGWEGRNFFETWMEYIQQSVTKDNKRRDAISIINGSQLLINQMGRTEDDILASYTFYDVFPTNISEIELNMSNNDQVETFSVTFSYSYFISEDVTKD